MSAANAVVERLRAGIRDIPDFPKPGIVFKDITPVLADAELLELATTAMAKPFRNSGLDRVVGIESRGFILGAIVARELNVGFVPVRKPGKLPGHKTRIEYALEYGSDALEVHTDACERGARVLIVDDVLATGGTAAATCALIEGLGAEIVGLSFLVSLSFLDGVAKLGGRRVESVLTY